MSIVRVRAKVDGKVRQPYAQIGGKSGNLTRGPVSGSNVNTPFMGKTIRDIQTVFPSVKQSPVGAKSERFTPDSKPENSKSFRLKRGKNVADMTDDEFEKFASAFDDVTYWELQAQRGIYPADDSAEFEDYE